MKLKAKWIWKKRQNYNCYNDTIIARKKFRPGKFCKAVIRATADSYYRLYINKQWVNNGPARSWPEHFQYDVIDVTSYLRQGQNEIEIIARYYGTGDFHRVCRQAGLLAQLDITLHSGASQTIISDASWEIADAKAWRSNTPKVSVQMEPAEYYDAQKETSCDFGKAAALFDTHKGPWKNLAPRDVALMTKKPFPLKSFLEANITKADGINFCVPVPRLIYPDLIEANRFTHSPFGIATVVRSKKKCTVKITSESFRVDHFKISVNGIHNPSGKYHLSAGNNLVIGFTRAFFAHDKDIAIRFAGSAPLSFTNPLGSRYENPWCFIPFEEFAFAADDMQWNDFFRLNPKLKTMVDTFNAETDALLKTIVNKKTLLNALKGRIKHLPSEKMFVEDTFWQFQRRQVVGKGTMCAANPDAILNNRGETAVITPHPKGDVELVYDLGEQNCGYYHFELSAEAGVIVDIYGIEYIDKDGKIQHTTENRNGMRYVTKKGLNSFVSLKRRSGRYIFITIRNQKSPVHLHKFELIESTYPVQKIGGFACSDEKLNRIHDLCARTLKLCMEDTFTDCPLYEQTLWVGDARNESLYAYAAFGATDIARRCIDLGAQSLERYPMVGCQIPSTWDCILPAWSFLWGISIRDHYWFTGDTVFLKRLWPATIKNLKGAEQFINEQGLFSASFWNLFDWADIDQGCDAVIHNSMFFVGAIDAAIQCGKILDDRKTILWLKALRNKLCTAINTLWDKKKRSYPDSIHNDGKISPSISQHTSFLSILYDIAEKPMLSAALKNVLSPPSKMVKVGSPFAMQYLYETLEKSGRYGEIIKSIYENYLPMLDVGATTAWEVFPDSPVRPAGFPTRSHCHAWSAAPVYFLGRVILGIRQTSAGGASFEISPFLCGLSRAKGSTASAKGTITVAWERIGKTLHITIAKPAEVRIKFVPNKSHNGLSVIVNGRHIK